MIVGSVASAQETGVVAKRESKKYFPGDFVHIIVTAPQDTVKITSILPSNDRVELVHDRRTNIWNGLWQVPIGFKPGSYTAVLEGKDMEGNTFSGYTAPFVIGEMAIIAKIIKAPSPEVEPREERSRRLELIAAQLADQAHRAISSKKAKPSLAIKKKTAARLKPRTKSKRININLVEVENEKMLNVTEVKLVTITRYYLGKMAWDKVQTSLEYLTRLDPKNKEYRQMLHRVRTVIQTEKEKNK